MLLNLLKKLLFLLLVFILTPICALDSYGIQDRSAGAGLVSTNLDNDPRPDLISAFIDMPDGAYDIIYYRVAKNIDEDQNANWSGTKATHINFKNEHLQGLGITIGDINGDDKKDMVFVVMDNPQGENKIRYKIGWSIDSNGDIGYNNVSETIFVNDDNLTIGDTSDGLGASLWDIDKNGKLDMVIVWSDSNNNNNCNSFGHLIDDQSFAESNTNNGHCHYTNTNSLYGIVLWNLNSDGKYEKMSDRFELEGSGKYQVMSGIGVEMTNLDTDPAPELIYSFIDERFNTDVNNAYQENKFYHSVGWNMYLDENRTIQFHKTDKIKELTNNGNQNNAGMGVAVAQMDGDHSKELIYNSIDSPIDRDDAILINIKKNFNKGEALLGKQFNKISTPNRTELITHQGTVISLSLDNERNSFTYSIMQEDESWSDIQKLTFPDLPKDKSVVNTVKNAPFSYEYKHRDISTIAFHPFSDGEYLYLFRTDGKFIYADRFILDTVEKRLNAPYDTRYQRSGQKCTPSDDDIDTIGYENMDKKPFHEPTVAIWYLKNRGISIQDFSVELIPTIISGEARWQFFILDASGYAGMHTLSFRKAPKDICDEEKHRVYFQGFFSDKDKNIKYTKQDEDGKNTEEEGTKILHGIIHPQSYSAEELGYAGQFFKYGLDSVSYANQQICEDKLIKREHRIKVILPKYQSNNAMMLEIDYGVNSFGELSDINKNIKSSYIDKGCDEESDIESYKSELPEVTESKPFIYDSADGFLHLLYKIHGLQYSMIYDPHKNSWRHEGSSGNQQIKGGWGRWYGDNSYARIPWFSYPTPLYKGDKHGFGATAAEYGSYTYDTDGHIEGILKRAYAFVKPNSNRDEKVHIMTEYISELDIKYIGQAKIDSTIVGYIEGAPPVPSVNLTNKEKDYSGITSVEMLMADSTAQSYVKSRDTGINFSTSGFGSGVAWKINMSYSWLSEETVGQQSTESLQMKQKLKGSWSDEQKQWIPDNIGMVAVRGTKADVYGLYLKGNDALFSYKIIPIPNSEEETLTPFVINDNYIKNGSLKGEDGKSSYAKDKELAQIKDDIIEAEAKIEGYFNRNSYPFAFEGIDKQTKYDQFSKRNIINTYEWSAAGGSRSISTSHMSQMSDTLGGSFNFLGMIGSGGEFSFFGATTKGQIIFGGHIKRTFKETAKSTHSFKLSVKADIDDDGVLDAKLSPIEAGKVDYYKWETAYLEPSSDNFNDFFNRVVDRKWLSSNNKFAKELRDARNCPNDAWRIRYFVTFESHTYEEGK